MDECRECWRGSGAAGGEEVLPADFAHAEAVAVVEDDGAFGAAFADDFANVVDVNDGGAVDADEFFGIEGDGELLDGFANEEAFGADVKAGVVVGGFDPFDVGGGDEGVFAAVVDEEAFGIGGLFCRGRNVEGFENCLELLVRGERGFGGDAVFKDGESFFEALGSTGLVR